MKRAKSPLEGHNSLPPPISDEARENQMISLAIDLAEKQLREGNASSQVITHFLKLGSSKEKLEKQMMEKQKELLDAKAEALRASERAEAMYAEVLEAMKKYSGG